MSAVEDFSAPPKALFLIAHLLQNTRAWAESFDVQAAPFDPQLDSREMEDGDFYSPPGTFDFAMKHSEQNTKEMAELGRLLHQDNCFGAVVQLLVKWLHQRPSGLPLDSERTDELVETAASSMAGRDTNVPVSSEMAVRHMAGKEDRNIPDSGTPRKYDH